MSEPVGAGPRRWPGYLAAFIAFCVFGGVAALPWIAKLGSGPSWVVAGSSQEVPQLKAPALPSSLPAVDFVNGPRAAPPTTNGATAATLVKAEDKRIRSALRDATKLVKPTVKQIGSGLPTIILPGRPAPYTTDDLVKAGALTSLPNGGGYLLVDSVVVSAGGTLQLGGSAMTVLRMLTNSSGFSSIVVSEGTLDLSGASPDVPTTVTSWDPDRKDVVADDGTGRAYIRAIASKMTLNYLHTRELGFWSGRTGGAAWTGSSASPSSGEAVSSTFEAGVYGAYLSNTKGVKFSNDVFESNEADGIRLHRSVVGTTVKASLSLRNGGSGFVVDRAATDDLLTGDLAENNGTNGFLLDGRALVSGLSPSGASTSESNGTQLVGSQATGNGKVGILVEGGQTTKLVNNTVCSPRIGIALRDAAKGVQLTGNNVKCGGLVALEINPAVTGTVATRNTFGHAHIGVLIRAAPGVRLIGNHMVSNSIFGISIRGASPDVEGIANVVTGAGIRSLDLQQGAPSPLITKTNVAGFTHRDKITAVSYFRFHPILLVWSAILVAVLLASLFARIRRSRKKVGKLYAHTPALKQMPAQLYVPRAAYPPASPAPAPVPEMATAGAPATGSWGSSGPFTYPGLPVGWPPSQPAAGQDSNGHAESYANGNGNGNGYAGNGHGNGNGSNGHGSNGHGSNGYTEAPAPPPPQPVAAVVASAATAPMAPIVANHPVSAPTPPSTWQPLAQPVQVPTPVQVPAPVQAPVPVEVAAAPVQAPARPVEGPRNEGPPLEADLFSGPSWIGANGSSALSRVGKRRRRGTVVDQELSIFDPKPKS